MLSKIPKFDVARVQLDTAADLFLRGRYLPAITLAAAAEEILAKLLLPGVQTAQEELILLLVNKVGVSPKEARDVYLNGVRNALKHHSEQHADFVEVDEVVDSKVWIVRAMTNYLQLSTDIPPSLREFLRRQGGASRNGI